MTSSELSYRTAQPTRSLRILFAVNGIANVAGGALLLPLAGILDGPTGLSRSLLVGIGVFYLVYGSAMWFAATRPRPRPAAIVALIAVNLIWAIDCLLMVGTIVAHPTTLGSVLLAAEAATVTGLAALQHAGYRGSRVPDVGTPDEPMARRGAATIQQARG